MPLSLPGMHLSGQRRRVTSGLGCLLVINPPAIVKKPLTGDPVLRQAQEALQEAGCVNSQPASAFMQLCSSRGDTESPGNVHGPAFPTRLCQVTQLPLQVRLSLWAAGVLANKNT